MSGAEPRDGVARRFGVEDIAFDLGAASPVLVTARAFALRKCDRGRSNPPLAQGLLSVQTQTIAVIALPTLTPGAHAL
jgi:hypothetical protein